MKDFELGQVFEGEISGKPATVVVVRTYGDLADAAVAPDRWTIITLHKDNMAGWKHVPATESDWYLEGVWSDDHLLWSVFIPGFEAAWTFFGVRLPDLAADGGRIRVSGAENATDAELMPFDDAGGIGPEPIIGLAAATERLRVVADGPKQDG
jgi:hypothetical protein